MVLSERILSYEKTVKAECKGEGERGFSPMVLPERILSYERMAGVSFILVFVGWEEVKK